MKVEDLRGRHWDALAINEVALLRQTYQTAKLRVLVDGRERFEGAGLRRG